MRSINDYKFNKFGFATATATGNTEVVAAVPGNKIVVKSVFVVTTLANSIKFQSATNDITATYPFGANGGMVLPLNEEGWFETAAGEALNVNMSVATSTGVTVSYKLVKV